MAPLDLYLRNAHVLHALSVCYSVAGGARTKSRTQTTSVTFLNSSITWRNAYDVHMEGGEEEGGEGGGDERHLLCCHAFAGHAVYTDDDISWSGQA